MKFEARLRDGSCKTFDSAEELRDYKQWHGDDYGGIERIYAETDSGDSTSWNSCRNDYYYAREFEGKATRARHDESSSISTTKEKVTGGQKIIGGVIGLFMARFFLELGESLPGIGWIFSLFGLFMLISIGASIIHYIAKAFKDSL